MRLQFIVAIEELAELIQVLTKYIRLIDAEDNYLTWEHWNGERVEPMVEEIADVELMLYQLKYFWNLFDEVETEKALKIHRTLKRLKE